MWDRSAARSAGALRRLTTATLHWSPRVTALPTAAQQLPTSGTLEGAGCTVRTNPEQ